jgi:hypothetical protein
MIEVQNNCHAELDLDLEHESELENSYKIPSDGKYLILYTRRPNHNMRLKCIEKKHYNQEVVIAHKQPFC